MIARLARTLRDVSSRGRSCRERFRRHEGIGQFFFRSEETPADIDDASDYHRQRLATGDRTAASLESSAAVQANR
jgi:hypothetical protein